jgi:CubicO group peptidase (beta-lactamase class C family)
MRAFVCMAIVAFVSTAAAQTGQYPQPTFTDSARATKLAAAFPGLDARMVQALTDLNAPGLSWGVVVDGQLAASGGVGVANVTSKSAVTPDTVFRIASMTKSFTAMAILKLRDDGRLGLDDPAGKYIPELAKMTLPTTDAPAITVRHLLTHSAGFPEDNPWGDRQLAVPATTLHQWVAAGLPFSTSPATAYEYANYGFALLGQVVARASGMPYRQYVTTRILQPLGMTSTSWDARDVPADRLAHGYRKTSTGWDEEIPLADGSFGAMGGLFTSGRDLGKYVAFMLSAWPPRDEPDRGPVRRSSLREMQQGQRFISLTVAKATAETPFNAAARAYGYGLSSTADCRFRQLVSHGGGLPGFGSNMVWLPEYGVGVYTMANVTYASAGSVARAILDRLVATGALQPRQLPASEPLVQVREAVTRLVNNWNDADLTRVAADNLFLDRSLAERRAEAGSLTSKLGACRAEDPIHAENWLRGRFRLTCEHGSLDVVVTMAPTRPPTVQHLELIEGHPSEASPQPVPDGPCVP